jgi:outer membrane protein W
MKTWKLALVLGVFVVVAASPALAVDEGKNFIRFGAQYVIPTGDYTDSATGVKVNAKDAAGLAVQYERKFNRLFGLEFGLAYSKHDFEAVSAGTSFTIADATMMPLSIAGNFHVLKDKKLDFYLGPQIAYVTYGDLTFKGVAAGAPGEGQKSDLGYGAVIGLDIPFGSGKWGLSMQMRYLQTQAEEDVPGGVAVDINPLAIQVAAAVKF